LWAVFFGNLIELLALLERASTDLSLAVELVQNAHRPDVRDKFEAELAQRLHNYVAGTMTLVEHSRRIMRDRAGPTAEEFANKKAELLGNLVVPFIQDLRNFTLHRSLPFFRHNLSITNVGTPEQQFASELRLSVKELLEWDRWSAPSRRFLEEQGDAVALRPVVRQHGELLVAINFWLCHALTEDNKVALAEVDQLVVEYNAALMGTGDIAQAERYTEWWTRMRNTPGGAMEPPTS
jgi:hypothetical protein